MRATLIASVLALSLPAVALAASAPQPSVNVRPPNHCPSVTVPALDAASKDAAKMTTKIKPEGARSAPAGKVYSPKIAAAQGAGKGPACARVMDESPKESH